MKAHKMPSKQISQNTEQSPTPVSVSTRTLAFWTSGGIMI